MAWGKSTKVRKFRPGARMLGIFDLIEAFDRGCYVFVHGKPYHPAVLRNWSLVCLEGVCRNGFAHVAELTPEWIAAEEMKEALRGE